MTNLPDLSNCLKAAKSCAVEFSPDYGPEPSAKHAYAKTRGSLYIATQYNARGKAVFKVGFSKSPGNRARVQQCQLIAYAPARLIDEMAAHNFLSGWRITGEWYRPCRRIERLLFYIGAYGSIPGELIALGNALDDLFAMKMQYRERFAELSEFFSGREECRMDWPRMAFGPNSGPDKSDYSWAFEALERGRQSARSLPTGGDDAE